jgi:catecholate siderophore receptor
MRRFFGRVPRCAIRLPAWVGPENAPAVSGTVAVGSARAADCEIFRRSVEIMSSQSGKSSLPLSLRNHALFLTAAVIAPVAAVEATAADGAGTNAPASLHKTLVEASPLPEVASPKFTQPILDTPQTIVAVPREVFTQQGAMTLSDVLRNTPGITFAAGEGGNVAAGDQFFMRGAETPVFIDGIRDTGGYSRDVYNMESVEIFKGPTGADNGRGGAAGYVNQVSKTARLANEYSGSFSYGTADQKRLSADLNQRLNLGKEDDWINNSAVRLNGLWLDGGSPGRDYVENNRWAISPSVSFGLNTDTRVTLVGSYLEQNNIPDSGLPYVAQPGASPYSVSQKNSYIQTDEDFDRVKNGRVLAIVEHTVNPSLTLRSKSNFTGTDRDALMNFFQNSSTNLVTFPTNTTPINPATGALPPDYVAVDLVNGTVTPRRLRTQQANQIFFQEFSANGNVETGFIEHKLGGGLDFTHETQETPTWQAVGGAVTGLVSPDPSRVSTVAQLPYRAANNPYAEARINTLGAYFFDTMELTKRFLLSGSVRLDHYDVRSRTLAPVTVAAPAPVTDELGTDGELVSWKAGLTYKPVDIGSLYVSYGNSFTPPGSAFNLSATASNQNNPNLDPQESRIVEVGTKWELFDKRLSTALALFNSKSLNIVSTDATTAQVSQNIDEEINGIEFGVSGTIVRNWMVFGGVALLDGERNSTGTSAAATSDGAALRFMPSVSANLWTSYKLPFDVTIGAGFQYTAAVSRATVLNTGSTATSAGEVPANVVFNAMIAYDFSKNFNIRLNVNNLADQDTYRLNNNGGRYYPSVPRSFLVTANLAF